jgi:hypothetical protein
MQGLLFMEGRVNIPVAFPGQRELAARQVLTAKSRYDRIKFLPSRQSLLL